MQARGRHVLGLLHVSYRTGHVCHAAVFVPLVIVVHSRPPYRLGLLFWRRRRGTETAVGDLAANEATVTNATRSGVGLEQRWATLALWHRSTAAYGRCTTHIPRAGLQARCRDLRRRRAGDDSCACRSLSYATKVGKRREQVLVAGEGARRVFARKESRGRHKAGDSSMRCETGSIAESILHLLIGGSPTLLLAPFWLARRF